MAHGMRISCTRRRSTVLAMEPPSTPSAKTLVKALVGLARAVAATGKAPRGVCQGRNAGNIVRRVELMTALLEEVRESSRPIPPTAVLAFRELHGLMQRVFLLLEECRESSTFWLLMEQEMYAHQFYELTQGLGSVLSALPLELLDLSEEVMEQTVLVRAQLVRARPTLVPAELQLREDVLQMLGMEAPGHARMKRLFEMLHLGNGRDCETEIHRLEELAAAGSEFGVAGLISFVRYGKYALYSAEFESHGVEEVRPVSSETSVSSATMVNPPVEFLCSITLELMLDPVIVATGQTYDRASITRWVDAGHATCPKTGQKLAHKDLIPNFALRSLIAQWCEDNNVPFADQGSSRKRRGAGMQQHVPSAGVGLQAMKLTAALLCEKLASGTPHVQKQVARELRLLSKVGAENRVCIAEAGGISMLLPLLSSSDAKTQEHAVTTLLNLSIVEDIKREIVAAAGALDSIIEVLKSGHTMESRENAAAALFSLSVSDAVKVEIGSKLGAIPALVLLLKEGSQQRGKRDAATALFNLAVYHGNKAKIIDAGAVPALLALIGHESETVSDACAAVLALLVTSTEGISALRDAAAIASLVPLLRHGSPKAREYAASVLLAMCKSGDAKILDDIFLHTTTIVQFLYHVLTSGTLRAKRKASTLLKLLRSLQEPDADPSRIRQIIL